MGILEAGEAKTTIDSHYAQIISRLNTVNFTLLSGWALKEKQKYGKKGAGKRIAKKVRKILEGYFLAGNADKSDHYTVQDMYQALQQRVLEGDIEAEDFLKVSTIQSWIGRYTRQHREHTAQTSII
ncbi:hypothetical protein C2G38_2041610 [Gigaspora rosea]|uniref:Uncharacterized protein n=1 Tax=Gigaspora rosea TaxID=44941 RepID=A0A397UR85_9GLOM|nr:hypothetical protein C2G38_2041610 [Gigaspora rosea]